MNPNMDVMQILDDLVSTDPCLIDHDGNCQTHAWFHWGECPHWRGLKLLREAGVRR